MPVTEPWGASLGVGRSTYRHGNLRAALIAVGVEMASEGGPQAVVLREATRRAGVAPNAAYRHFANHADLLWAVRSVALGMMARAMEREMKQALGRERPDFSLHADDADAEVRARALLAAVGTGYLRFAIMQTNLFRTAFVCGPLDMSRIDDAARVGESGRDPYELLGCALDALVTVGVLPAVDRPDAEYLAWSAVHGMSLLIIDGPLARADMTRLRSLGARLLAMIEFGLSAGRNGDER